LYSTAARRQKNAFLRCISTVADRSPSWAGAQPIKVAGPDDAIAKQVVTLPVSAPSIAEAAFGGT